MRRFKTLLVVGSILGGVILLLVVGEILEKTRQTEPAHNSPLPLSAITREPTATRPAHCVPIPRNPTQSEPPTATPDLYHTSEPAVFRSVTPIPFSHIYDLSPELPLEEKSMLTVFRCDGSFDQYWAGTDVDIDLYLQLGPGDVILASAPPAFMMGHRPPEPETFASATPGLGWATVYP